jgi:hypothetical protein
MHCLQLNFSRKQHLQLIKNQPSIEWVANDASRKQ